MRQAILSLLVLMSSSLWAAPPLERPNPVTGIVDFNSIRLDPIESLTLERGRWANSFTVTYFNQFNLTWHTTRVHDDRGLQRSPLTLDELRFIEREFPDDEVYHIDIEGWRGDFTLSYGLPKNLTLTAQIPYVSFGDGPRMDGVAESLHELFTTRTFGRDVFPRGENAIYLRSVSRRFVELDAGDSGLGDITLSLSMPIGDPAKEQNVVFAIQPPTGTEGTFRGSGGWDLGARWFRKWRNDRRAWLAGAGVSWQDPSGDVAGFERALTWTLLGEVAQTIKGNFWGRLGLRVGGSPLADEFPDTSAGEPTFFYRIGCGYDLPDDSFIYLDIGEEIAPGTGIDADWSFHLGWVVRR